MLDGSVSSSCALLSHMPHATLDDYLFFPLKMIVITFLPPHLDDGARDSRAHEAASQSTSKTLREGTNVN
jgi:hypothetical protein